MTINDLLTMTRKQRQQHYGSIRPDHAHPYYGFKDNGEFYTSTVEITDCTMAFYPYRLFTYAPEFFL